MAPSSLSTRVMRAAERTNVGSHMNVSNDAALTGFGLGIVLRAQEVVDWPGSRSERKVRQNVVFYLLYVAACKRSQDVLRPPRDR